MNKEDIRELTDEELVEKISSEQLRYKKLRFNHTVSPLDNPLVLRGVRRDIARLKTELKNRQIANQKEQA
ncbi:MAG: 50S ribosomal protein L29 [Chitinophagales bacterium]|nr:50S ribosomal protein L29 [Chitinophagales bacterium]